MAASLLGGSPQSNSRRLPLFKPFKAPHSRGVLATPVRGLLPRISVFLEHEALDVPFLPPIEKAAGVDAQPFTDAVVVAAPFAHPR